MDFDSVQKVLAALERERVEYVVFGAVAINLLGLPRATEDLALFVAPEPENIERLKTALRSVFADPSIEDIKAEELLGEYPAVQYVPPGRDVLYRHSDPSGRGLPLRGHYLDSARFRRSHRERGDAGNLTA